MKNNKGFTLIEIGLVLFVIGILVAIIIPSFTQGIRNKANAKLLIRQSAKHFENIKTIADSCNLAIDSIIDIYRKSAITNPSNSYFSEIMLKGNSAISNTYKYCYNQANIAYTGYVNRVPAALGVLALAGQRQINITPGNTFYQINYLTYDLAIEIIKQLNLDPNDYPYSAGAIYYPVNQTGMTIYSESNVTIHIVRGY